MDVRKKLVSRAELQFLLSSYFTNFEIESLHTRSFITSRYETLAREQSLWSLEIWENQELVGSAVVCERTLKYLATPIKICFFSQIWIEKKHRKKGHLSFLMKELDLIANFLNSDASIVISRKAVKDLYTKYGFEGFSKFPVVKFSKSELSTSSCETRTIRLQSIQNAFESTYGSQDIFFLRSWEYWKAVLKNIQGDAMQLHTYEINGSFFYLVIQLNEVVEIASIDNSRWPEIVDFLFSSGLDTFRIDEKHPAHKEMLAYNAVYSVRPEPREGHMMKIYNIESQCEQSRAKANKLQKIVSEMNLNILPLDQW